MAAFQGEFFLECVGALPGTITPYRPHFAQGRAPVPGAEQGIANPDGLGFMGVVGAHKPGFVVATFGGCLQAVVGNHAWLLGMAD